MCNKNKPSIYPIRGLSANLSPSLITGQGLFPSFPVSLPVSHWPVLHSLTNHRLPFNFSTQPWRMTSLSQLLYLSFSCLQSLHSFSCFIHVQSLHFLDILLHHLSTKSRQEVLDNLICASQVSVSVCLHGYFFLVLGFVPFSILLDSLIFVHSLSKLFHLFDSLHSSYLCARTILFHFCFKFSGFGI